MLHRYIPVYHIKLLIIHIIFKGGIFMKKFITILISAIIAVQPLSIYASNNNNIKITSAEDIQLSIIQDNENIRVAQEINQDNIIISTYYKLDNIVVTETYDKNKENLINKQELNLNKISNNSRVSQHTFSNREYYVSSSGYWSLRSGDSRKKGYENDQNINNLEKFRYAVEDVNKSELALIGVIGGGIAGSVISALLTGGASAALAITGTIAGASAAIASLSSDINNADYYYYKVIF